MIESGRVEEGKTWTQILTKVILDLEATRESIAKGIPTLLATLEKPLSFQQQRGRLGNVTHKGTSEKLSFTDLKLMTSKENKSGKPPT